MSTFSLVAAVLAGVAISLIVGTGLGNFVGLLWQRRERRRHPWFCARE